MKTIVASLMGGILVAVMVLSVIILMPTQIEGFQEVIKQESMHPCQKAVIDNFELHKKNANLMSSFTSQEDLDKWSKEASVKLEHYKQIAIKNNCENTQSEWMTEEFQKELQSILDKGF